MMLKKILIIKGKTQYGVMRDFADALANGFISQNITVDFLDCDWADNNPNKIIAKTSEYDMVLSFNGILLGFQEHILKNPNTLFWSFLVDHPYHHHWRMLAKCNNHVVSCVDRNHVSYIQKYYQNIEHTCFVPHGGNVISQETIPYEERQYQVCLFGTYGNMEEYDSQIHSLPEPNKSIVISIAQQLKIGSTLTFEELFDIELESRGIQLPKKMYTELISSLSFVDPYIRAYNRTKLLDSLTSAGIVVDVFGNGWDKYPCKHPNNIVIHGNVPYDEVLSVMSNSKIVLNPLPLFRDGSHERVFSSMLCGAVCLSEINNYLSENFRHGEDIVFFQMSDLDSMTDNIKLLLSNSRLGKNIAKRGYEKASALHLWANRSKEIINIAEAILNERLYDKEFILIKSENDYQFNCFANYIINTTPRTLANKFKSTFHFHETNNYEYANALYTILAYSGRWPEKDIEGNIYFRNLTKHLKQHLNDYVKLYNSLGDDISKATLLGILNNCISMDSSDLANIVSDKETFELSLDSNFNIKVLNNPLEALISFVETELPNLSSNTILLRYYDRFIIPKEIYLYIQ